MIDAKIERQNELIDSDIKVSINGLKKNQPIKIILKMIDEMGQVWVSNYSLVADEEQIEIDFLKILSYGNYSKLSKKCFFRFIKSAIYNLMLLKVIEDKSIRHNFIKFNNLAQNAYISIFVDEEKIFVKEFLLKIKGDDVIEKEIMKPFVGKFYSKKGNENMPNIIVLGGSASGFKWSEQIASLLASHGFNTLAISYFDYSGKHGQKRELINIPLEYFESAINWIQNWDFIRNKNIGVIGNSKGAEAALLLGEYFGDKIKSIVAYVPPAFSFEGVYLGKKRRKYKENSSWSLKGDILDYLEYPIETKLGVVMKPYYLRDIHDKAINKSKESEKEKAIINLDKYLGKVLLISSSQDGTWDSEGMCRILKKCNKNLEHKNFEDSGHVFMLPNLPPYRESSKISIQGSLVSNEKAWMLTKSHLEKTLKNTFEVEKRNNSI